MGIVEGPSIAHPNSLKDLRRISEPIARIDVGSVRITSYNVCYTKLLRLETATEALREIYASHQRDRDEKALQLVYHMGQHVGAMRTDFASFTKASESPAALNALNSMGDEILHSYNFV